MSKTATPIATALADALDDSPRVVWNWRDGWKMLSVRLNTAGAVLNILAGSAALAIPAAAPIYLMRGMAAFLYVTAAIFIASALGRLLVQDKVAGSSSIPPLDETDKAGA